MRRRDFITLLGGAAAAWPLGARAQQRAVIGYLGVGSPETQAFAIANFRKGLSEAGYVEGRNVVIEYRWASEDDRLPELADDLVRRQVAVIVTLGSTAAALAAKAATRTIPIVFNTGADPVQYGLVTSINRPGGNTTGVTSMSIDLSAKRFEILRELLPKAERFALLVNPNNPATGAVITDIRAAADGLHIEVVTARTSAEINTAFAIIAQMRVEALMVAADALFNNRRVQLATLSAFHRIAAIYPFRPIVEAGGLMSYGADGNEQPRLAGQYVGRVLKGEKPADLPILRATKFEFLVNLQTAKMLDLAIPDTLLALANEVIE
jgi:putative ABC transport system substrate-binding protein